MKEKKNIDRLFQEQLKDFEARPDEQVWLNIEAELNKDKKKRKIIPLWFRYSGTAAALLLGFFAFNVVFNTNTTIQETVVFDSKKTIENKDSTKIKKEKEANTFLIKENQQVVSNNQKTVRKNEKENTSFATTKKITNQKKNQNNTRIYISKNNSSLKEMIPNHSEVKSYALEDKENATDHINKIETNSNKTDKKIKFQTKNNTKIAEEDSKGQTKTTPEAPNQLEEILKKKEEEKQIVAVDNTKKWQIVPNIAPIYLNSNSGGSPIDNELSQNEKTSDKSISYGIGVNYAVNRKITLRTGVNKVVLGYNTNDVLYSAGFATNNMSNIDYISNSSIEVRNDATYNTLTASEKNIQKTETGNINQKMGYYELPLEVSYTLLDKKIGISVIGGFSTLFLNENKVSLVSSQTNIALGEANNLNKVHISSNFGLGFKYQLMKSFQFNFEPMLKYQLNTFSRDDNNFKPLFIGLYSGVSYRF